MSYREEPLELGFSQVWRRKKQYREDCVYNKWASHYMDPSVNTIEPDTIGCCDSG